MEYGHTFAICAYKESEYLKECIRSLIRQTYKSKIIMTTSTPNEKIKALSDQYRIPLFVRDGKSDIRDDWNFAYDSADTKWVTIAHQDDVYHKRYAERLREHVIDVEDAIAFVTDYLPLKDGRVGKRDVNSTIRHFLRSPIKNEKRSRSRFWKRAILSLGNSICCPSVSYNKEVLGDSFFTSKLKFNIDWDTFLKLAETEGAFVYLDEPLLYYRIHDGATSKDFIVNHTRETDDYYMFRKFWPKWIAALIMVFYRAAYKTYD